MKYLMNFNQLNESKILKKEDIDSFKKNFSLLNNSFQESKELGRRNVNPQKEFENFLQTLKRVRMVFLESNINIEDFSMYFPKLFKFVNDSMNVRDIRQATEIKGNIYKIMPLIQQDFEKFINKKESEIKTYQSNENTEKK